MKRPKAKRIETATQIAARAGCSRQLVDRLLRRGHSPDEIVERVRERKADKVPRAAVPSITVPVNGHAATHELVTFAEAQRRKEEALAQLRELEVARKRGDLLPLAPWRAITIHVLKFQNDCLWLWPEDVSRELTMRPQCECAEIIRRRIEHLFHATETFFKGECLRYGIILSPTKPEPPRTELAYYERYVKDSRSGRIEIIPPEDRFEGAEWLRRHPSCSDPQRWFEIKRRKKQWDEDMAALLSRRAEWNLPDEVAPDTPPEAA
jgi:hypothetical protein